MRKKSKLKNTKLKVARGINESYSASVKSKPAKAHNSQTELVIRLATQVLDLSDKLEAALTRLAEAREATLKGLADIEQRLKKVEELAHKQITEQDLIDRYKKFVEPQQPWEPIRPVPLPPDPQPFPYIPRPYPDPNIIPAPWVAPNNSNPYPHTTIC